MRIRHLPVWVLHCLIFDGEHDTCCLDKNRVCGRTRKRVARIKAAEQLGISLMFILNMLNAIDRRKLQQVEWRRSSLDARSYTLKTFIVFHGGSINDPKEWAEADKTPHPEDSAFTKWHQFCHMDHWRLVSIRRAHAMGSCLPASSMAYSRKTGAERPHTLSLGYGATSFRLQSLR